MFHDQLLTVIKRSISVRIGKEICSNDKGRLKNDSNLPYYRDLSRLPYFFQLSIPSPKDLWGCIPAKFANFANFQRNRRSEPRPCLICPLLRVVKFRTFPSG